MNQKGFGLVQVIIAVTILGVLSLLFAQMIGDGMKGQNTVKTNATLDSQAYLANLMLSEPSACLSSFGIGTGGAPVAYSTTDGATLTKLYSPKRDAVDPTLYVPGTTSFLETGVKISDTSAQTANMKITPPLFPGILVGGGPNTEYTAELVLEFSKNAQSVLGSANDSRKFPITLHVNPANEIVYCKSAGSAVGGSSMPPPPAPCDKGLVMTGMNPDWTAKCEDPNMLVDEDAGVLGRRDPAPPGTIPLSCSYQVSDGRPSETGTKEVTKPCDGKKLTCSFESGEWKLINKKGTRIPCMNGVTVDYPPLESNLLPMGTYALIDPATTSNICFISADQDKPCNNIAPEPLTGSAVKETRKSEITRKDGTKVVKDVPGLYLPSATAPGGGYFFSTGGICAYNGSKWVRYPKITGTDSTGCQGGLLTSPK